MSSHGLCNWHCSGVQSRFQGDAYKWRWFVPGCPACIAKWVGRKVPANVLTPDELIAASRTRTSPGRMRKEAAGRRAAYWARARVA